jgi:hypothetical protein
MLSFNPSPVRKSHANHCQLNMQSNGQRLFLCKIIFSQHTCIVLLDVCEEYDGKKCLIEEKNYFLLYAFDIVICKSKTRTLFNIK